jgi:hypothetical protein
MTNRHDGWGPVKSALVASVSRSATDGPAPRSGRPVLQIRLEPSQADSWRLAANYAGCTLSDLVRLSVGALVRWGRQRSQGDLIGAGRTLRGWRALASRTYEGWRYEAAGLDACPTCGQARPRARARAAERQGPKRQAPRAR